MREEILGNIENPRQLEKLYRDNKTAFRREFNNIYPEVKNNTTAQIWNERLNFENEEISWGSSNELGFVIMASLIAGLIAKIPDMASIREEYFFQRNIAFIVFPLLAAYFSYKQKIRPKNLFIICMAFLVSAIYINLLPDNHKSDTLLLSCIHLPLFLWTVLGFTFVGDKYNDPDRRLDFLRYIGDLAVMTAVILIAGGLLTAVTFGLFSLIHVNIEHFYSEYVIVWGLSAAPIVSTYLVRTNPQLVNKVSPVIAKVFTPLVLVTLVCYLAAIVYSGKDPYNDREFLIIFNLLLVGVMAIILFSVVETSRNSGGRIATYMLLALSAVTVVINGIALSAIVFRISEWGITPNRMAVLGGNILILINLIQVTYHLFKATKDSNEIHEVEKSIASFLPIYSLWTIVVVFVFPLLFEFR